MRGAVPRWTTREKLLRWYNSLPAEQRMVPPTPEPIEDEEPDVEFVRRLVAQAVQRSSASWVADAVGISHTAAKEFAQGSTPTTRTWEKLLAWYRVQKAAGLAVLHRELSKEIRFQPTADTADRAAMDILMSSFPPPGAPRRAAPGTPGTGGRAPSRRPGGASVGPAAPRPAPHSVT
jgi:hypothetical protein